MDAPSPSVIAQATQVILAGGVVVAPTETRYGLLARGDSQTALEKVYELKKRLLTQPTALMVPDRAALPRFGVMTPEAERLAAAYLPGPVTLVLRALHDWAPPRVVDGRIGLRCSSAPVVAALLASARCDLTATSANLSGEPEPDTVDEINAEFGNEVDLYLDGGPLRGPVSTVVDCSAPGVKVLREGAIPAADIKRTAVSHGQ